MVSEKKDEWIFEYETNQHPEKLIFTVAPITYEDRHMGGSMLDDARDWQKQLETEGITKNT